MFIIFHLGIFVDSASQRQGLFNYDDSLMLLAKAPQMEEYLLQGCPAFSDLRAQLTVPSDEYETSLYRYESYKNFFLVCHPLHSVLMIGVHALGFSWETSSNGIRLGEFGVLNWLWDQGVRISALIGDGTELVTVESNSSALFPADASEIKMINDDASSVLAEIIR